MHGVSQWDNKRPLIITVDATVHYEMVLKVYNTVARLGISNISHTTQRE